MAGRLLHGLVEHDHNRRSERQKGQSKMSHDIEQNEDYMYYVGDGLPWHKLGLQQDRRMTLEEVVAGLPRMGETPVLCRVFYRDPSKTERAAMECSNKRAIVYPSNGTFIGMASEHYQPKSYADAFDKAFGWVESLGAWVSGAALLKGGQRAFIMARVPALDFSVGDNDAHQIWLTLFAGSDGKTGIYPMATTVRTVCRNTAEAGLAEACGNERGFRIAHHGNVDAKLEKASVVLGQLTETRDAYQRAMGVLLARKLNLSESQDIVRQLIPGNSTRSDNQRISILDLMQRGKGNRAYDGTAYALWQGVTDFVDHDAVRSSKGDINEKRFLYAVEGAGANLKADALKLLLSDAPVKVAA